MTENVASRYLATLAEHGIESLFVNAGTDFAPIVEAYAHNKEAGGATLPVPVVCTHENLAAGMAHGAYLASGRPQALMLHVSVGTANAVCAVTNAAREHVPMLVTAGRSPILEHTQAQGGFRHGRDPFGRSFLLTSLLSSRHLNNHFGHGNTRNHTEILE